MGKRITLLFLLATLFYVSQGASDTKNFYLFLNDGTRITLAVGDSPRLYFNDDVIRIVTPHLDVEYPMAEIGRITEDASNDIESEMAGQDYKVEIRANEVLLTGFQPKAMVSVLTPQGQKIATYFTDELGTLSISTDKYAPGIYLFTTHSFTYKLMKK